jgi:PhnB protein
LPDGQTIMHAEIVIGDSIVMMTEENPAYGCLSPLSLNGSTVTLHLFVEDVDASFAQAVEAGATVKMPVMDAFWGDRYGQVVDPYGHLWSLATHKEDLTPEQMKEKMAAAFSDQAAPCA